MKTNLEHELLEIRQDLRDNLRYHRAQPVVDLGLCGEILYDIRRCNSLLNRLRFKKAS